MRASKLLVIGAGGIGCELLKNLVLTGFEHIEIIDLDTIDVSNLNRQFLFRARHVGQPKAVVAREVVLGLNPRAAETIVAHHANIKEPQFGLDYFQQVEERDGKKREGGGAQELGRTTWLNGSSAISIRAMVQLTQTCANIVFDQDGD